MKLHNVALAAAALAIALPTAASAQNITLKYLTAWDKRYEGTPIIAYDYGKMVEEASDGRIMYLATSCHLKFTAPRTGQAAPSTTPR
jgi:TRAP-type mannitol/chloroaromatic compound transport system substrate-binding protein